VPCSLQEIGIDPVIAKRAGLLHDLGKAIEADNGLTHAAAGANLLRSSR
jgi:ribonuclease Y